MVGYSYLVVTGWVYAEMLSATKAKKSIEEAMQFLERQYAVQKLTSIDKDKEQRLYYSVADTIGIRTALDKIYKSAGGTARAKTVIITPDEWDFGSDVSFFYKDIRLWTQVYDIMKQWRALPVAKREHLHTVQCIASFKDEAKRAEFTHWAEGMGYKKELDEESDSPQYGRFQVYLNHRENDMTEDNLFHWVRLLQEEAAKPSYAGEADFISIQKD